MKRVKSIIVILIKGLILLLTLGALVGGAPDYVPKQDVIWYHVHVVISFSVFILPLAGVCFSLDGFKKINILKGKGILVRMTFPIVVFFVVFLGAGIAFDYIESNLYSEEYIENLAIKESEAEAEAKEKQKEGNIFTNIFNTVFRSKEELTEEEQQQEKIRLVVEESLTKKDGKITVKPEQKLDIIDLLIENKKNDEDYNYILQVIDEVYMNYIADETKKLKPDDVNSIQTVLDNIDYIILEDFGIERLNKSNESLEAMLTIAQEIKRLDNLEAPSEHLNMDIDINSVALMDVYISHRIKNAQNIFGLNEYSDYYFATTEMGREIVISPNDSQEMKQGHMILQLAPNGEVELESNGFYTSYPLYDEVSNAYIENRENTEEYYSAYSIISLLKEDFEMCLDSLNKIINSEFSLVEKIENNNSNNDIIQDEKRFGFVETSSELMQSGYDFNPYNLTDNDPESCWVEGVSGYGEGEVIQFYNDMYLPNNISEIHITNGYNAESSDMYYKNSRAKELKIEFDDGTVIIETLKDTPNSQVIQLNKVVKTGSVTITILSVYPGTHYEDTCISDIIFY